MSHEAIDMTSEDMSIWYRVLWRPSVLPGLNRLMAMSIEQDRRDARIMADRTQYQARIRAVLRYR